MMIVKSAVVFVCAYACACIMYAPFFVFLRTIRYDTIDSGV